MELPQLTPRWEIPTRLGNLLAGGTEGLYIPKRGAFRLIFWSDHGSWIMISQVQGC